VPVRRPVRQQRRDDPLNLDGGSSSDDDGTDVDEDTVDTTKENHAPTPPAKRLRLFSPSPPPASRSPLSPHTPDPALPPEDAQMAWALAESLKAARSPATAAAAVSHSGGGGGGAGGDDDDDDDDYKRAIALSLAEADAQAWEGWESPPADVLPTGPAAPPATPAPPTTTSDAAHGPPAPYTLAAVVSHRGQTLHQGAYGGSQPWRAALLRR
jgi:hypothetical protein